MRFVDRDVRRIAGAVLDRRHWHALRRMFQVYEQPMRAIFRYATNSGAYPWQPGLRTPLGTVRPELTSYHDLLTVNEVFCRNDYGEGRHARTVVDIGANVGLAALFFLTRSTDVRVWCCEPDPANLRRLRHTLIDYLDRVTIISRAVTSEELDSVRFSAAGRYGHIDPEGPLVVPAIGIGALLDRIAQETQGIDLVKIDTEGTELDLVRAVPAHMSVGAIVYEDNDGRTRWTC